jgi:hypothetical protein
MRPFGKVAIAAFGSGTIERGNAAGHGGHQLRSCR